MFGLVDARGKEKHDIVVVVPGEEGCVRFVSFSAICKGEKPETDDSKNGFLILFTLELIFFLLVPKHLSSERIRNDGVILLFLEKSKVASNIVFEGGFV